MATTIMQDLAAARDDHGVKMLKKELLSSMKRRMSFEKTKLYSVATLLHPKYKRTMFQDHDNAEAALIALRWLVGEEMARSGSLAAGHAGQDLLLLLCVQLQRRLRLRVLPGQDAAVKVRCNDAQICVTLVYNIPSLGTRPSSR